MDRGAWWAAVHGVATSLAGACWAQTEFPSGCGSLYKELDTAEPAHVEGNGTPLQYSCLENPMDGGAWWAAVHGVAKSRT